MTARPNLPETSLQAFRSSADSRIGHRALIWDVLCDFLPQGLHCEEISDALMGRLSPIQVNRCMKKMEDDKLVERQKIAWSGMAGKGIVYASRVNRGGKMMAVWYAVMEGIAT